MKKIIKSKFLVLFLESLLDSEQCLFGSLSTISTKLPGTTNQSSKTGLAFPYSNSLSLNLVLATELTVVFSMLGNLIFFDYLSHSASVSCSVLSTNSLLLGSSGHGL